MRTLSLLLLPMLGACEMNSTSYCPDGFAEDVGSGYDNGYCKLDGYADRIEAEQGAYGFVKAVEGGCGPGDSTCGVTYEDDYPVEIYAIDDVLTLDDCRDANTDPIDGSAPKPSPIDTLDVSPMLVVNTDDLGRFWMALDPGNYCASTIDTIDDGRRARLVTASKGLVNATFVFDHGAY